MSGISGIRGENRDAGDGKNKQMKFVKRRTDFKVHSQIRKNDEICSSSFIWERKICLRAKCVGLYREKSRFTS